MRRTVASTTLLRAVLLCSLAAALFGQVPSVNGEGEAPAITNALAAEGIRVRSVSTSGSEVTVGYDHPSAEVDSVVDVLSKMGTILATVGEQMPSVQTVIVVQYFDDGQIMQITGTPEIGSAFVSQQISAEDFMAGLQFLPLTRGPLLVPGQCEPVAGETCADYAECACYPGETCDPANPLADERGCVPGPSPANAHLIGTEYVCDEGYGWNADLSACVPVQQCPPNAFHFDDDCHCEPGYEWNEAGTECVPARADSAATDITDGGRTGSSGSSSSVGSSFKALIDALIDWLKSLFG